MKTPSVINVHGSSFALMCAFILFACAAPFSTAYVQAVFVVITASFGVAATVAFWIIEATHPDGEVLSRFKSALADYATCWAAISIFVITLLKGAVPTG